MAETLGGHGHTLAKITVVACLISYLLGASRRPEMTSLWQHGGDERCTDTRA